MNIEHYSRHLENNNSNHGKINLKAIALLFIFIATLTFLAITKLMPVTRLNKSQISSPTSIQISEKPKSNDKDLVQRIEKEITNGSGTYTVFVYDINNHQEYGINENTVLTAASTIKIPILAVLYYLADRDEIDLEKIVIPQKGDIQDWGSGTIRYDPPGTPYSIKTLARLMMEKSDNTAAYILSNQIIGNNKIQKIIEDWGLTQTDMVNNKTSARDISILLIKMYKGEITNKALTAEMLGFMDASDYDDRIPQGLPENVKFYHKTGNEIGKVHDAAIVDIPKHPYYLGIFTIDITDEETAKKIMIAISKTVYDYMSRL